MDHPTVWIGAFTPSASQVAGCCNLDAINLYDARSGGGGITRIHNSASPIAWLDDYNLIYQPFNSTAMQLFSVTSGADVPIAAASVPVASLPAR